MPGPCVNCIHYAGDGICDEPSRVLANDRECIGQRGESCALAIPHRVSNRTDAAAYAAWKENQQAKGA